jgi:glucose-1-phosphate cytidylyltransferase
VIIPDAHGKILDFQEKPVIQGSWINAGFFAFEKKVFVHWKGRNLEADVLPNLAQKGLLYAYSHQGFWKSMDTSKDQQELEQMHKLGNPRWIVRSPAQGIELSREDTPRGKAAIA